MQLFDSVPELSVLLAELSNALMSQIQSTLE